MQLRLAIQNAQFCVCAENDRQEKDAYSHKNRNFALGMKEKADIRPRKSAPLPENWREDIRQAVEVMRNGGIILYPTDTIWGIGCDARNDDAVRRIFQLKKRSDAKALISLVHNDVMVQAHVTEVPDVAWDLIELADRPLTIIYDNARGMSPLLMAEDGSAGIRVTQEPFSKALCQRMGSPVVSTSANVSGMPSPRCFNEISQEIINGVDYVCMSRREETENPPASGIIKLGAHGEVRVIR